MSKKADNKVYYKMASAPPLELYYEAPISKVEIHVSCRKLRNRDYLSKSDPMVILFTEHRCNREIIWKEFERTEVVVDNNNPSFTKSFILEYHFEQLQRLKFEVYDSDCACKNLIKHDYLGYVVVTLGSIMGEYGTKVTKRLLDKKGNHMNSTISFSAEELNDSKEMVSLTLQCRKLQKKKMLGHVDPFLVFYRHGIENSEYVAVHRTEVIKNNLNPRWNEVSIPLTSLCNGDKHRPIKIECRDWNFDGSHSIIGECIVTVDEMLRGENFSRQLLNSKKLNKRYYQNSGLLDLLHIELKCEPSFLDYIAGGVELCVHVAIDLSASNGNPLHPSSLHFLSKDTPNKYVQALTAIGQICEDYDSDKLIPAYGFGAKIHGNVYHDFHLNRQANPSCVGVAGVLEAYEDFLPTAQLYGPTNFSPVINLVTRMTSSQLQHNKYHILLILTDGVVTDMDQTKNAIIEASQYPISIIIVGIGDEDFTAMNELDSDHGTLTHQGKVAEQDIVQFVPFHNFTGSFAADDLAREVLFEVPNQLVTYMTRHGIKPQPSTQRGRDLSRKISAHRKISTPIMETDSMEDFSTSPDQGYRPSPRQIRSISPQQGVPRRKTSTPIMATNSMEAFSPPPDQGYRASPTQIRNIALQQGVVKKPLCRTNSVPARNTDLRKDALQRNMSVMEEEPIRERPSLQRTMSAKETNSRKVGLQRTMSAKEENSKKVALQRTMSAKEANSRKDRPALHRTMSAKEMAGRVADPVSRSRSIPSEMTPPAFPASRSGSIPSEMSPRFHATPRSGSISSDMSPRFPHASRSGSIPSEMSPRSLPAPRSGSISSDMSPRFPHASRSGSIPSEMSSSYHNKLISTQMVNPGSPARKPHGSLSRTHSVHSSKPSTQTNANNDSKMSAKEAALRTLSMYSYLPILEGGEKSGKNFMLIELGADN